MIYFDSSSSITLTFDDGAVSFEPVRSLRRRHLFDLCFRELQDMSNPRNPQASRMVPLMLIFKKYAVVLYYNTQASVPTINLV